MTLRGIGVQRGRIITMLTTTSAAQVPHRDSSITWPRFEVVSTEYHEHASATASSGTTSRETMCAYRLPVARAVSRVSRAHWIAKHSSAIVATERPNIALEIQESTSVIRGTSNTGKNDRYAQPKT